MNGEKPIAIEVADLRDALNQILDAASDRFGSTIDLAADHYWLLELADTYNLADQPTAYVGQLSDDVAEIRQLLASRNGDPVIWHDTQHVVGVLLRLASLDLLSDGSGVTP